MFKHVECHGLLLNYVTKQSEAGSISLYGGGQYGDKLATHLETGYSGNNGYFSIKSKAYKGGSYHLHIKPFNSREFERYADLKEEADVDLGVFFVGKYTFCCKVTLVPVSLASIDFLYLDNGTLHFNSGTSTQFLAKQTVYANEAISGVGGIAVCYKLSTSSTYSYISVQANPSSPQDTLSITINY